jgi:small subunit ribosomal protein S16
VATKIKLMRLGKMRAPYYRIVVADARTKRDGRVIETIGKYHPKEDPSFIEVKSDRAQYWLGVGAQPTDPVAAIFRVTGDWQKFKGEPAPPPMLVAAPKVDKAETFAAAARASAGITDVTAPLTPKQAKKASPKAAAEEAPAPVAQAPAEPAEAAEAAAAPAAEVEPPAAEVEPPAAEVEPPAAEVEPPAAEVEPPAAEVELPAAEAEPPAATDSTPAE